MDLLNETMGRIKQASEIAGITTDRCINCLQNTTYTRKIIKAEEIKGKR
jgi:hypothetical protein